MPGFKVTISHALTPREAIDRMQRLFEELKRENADKIGDLSESWNADLCKYSFRIMGFFVSGAISIKPSEVHIAGDLPLLAMLFKDQIESAISQRAANLLRGGTL
jgi:hypothetical protein